MNARWETAEEIAAEEGHRGVIFTGNDPQVLDHIICVWGSRVQKVFVTEGSTQGKLTLALARHFGISGVAIGESDQLDRELSGIDDTPLLGICSNFSRISLRSLTTPIFGFINLHPAPLPEFGGKTPWHHMRVKHHQVAACVAHEMTMHFDRGRQICRLEQHLPYDWDFELMRRITQELAGQIVASVLSPQSLGASLRRAYSEDLYLDSRIWPGVGGPVGIDFHEAPDQVYAHIQTQNTFEGYPVRTAWASGRLFEPVLSRAVFDERLVSCILRVLEAKSLVIGLRDQFVLHVKVGATSGCWRAGDYIGADVPMFIDP